MGRQLKHGGLLYLHGFCSSPAGWKTNCLQQALAARGLSGRLYCPQLPAVPAAATALIEHLVADAGGPVTLIGSSLGGHYASHVAEKLDLPAILINPAVISRLDLGRFVGDHANFHTGERFTLTPEHAAQLLAQVSAPTPGRYWLLLEEGDEVLDYRQAENFYAGCRQTILPGGDHSFTRFPDFIPQIIEFAGISRGL